MKIIVGHSNMDLDCIASIALARRLYPDHVPIKSGTIHPVARHLYNLYETELDFLPAKELRGEQVDGIVIVDTRSRARLKEYFRSLGTDDIPEDCPVTIYDHHPGEPHDFPGATVHGGNYGSTATILGLELMRRGVELSAAEATIALAGIYSDTGNFTHENVTADEFAVASYLIGQGATVRLVTSFLTSLREETQLELFHLALGGLSIHEIKGHAVATFHQTLEKNLPGLAAVVERVFEVEGPDALFGVFSVEDGPTILIGRSSKARVRVNEILGRFGGGGHFKAASAVVQNGDRPSSAEELIRNLLSETEAAILPALTASEIMTRDVLVLSPDWSLIEASVFLEKIDHTGAPVVNEDGRVVGFLTLRDIMKGRKRDRMQDPVKGYMTQRVVTCSPHDTMRDLERLFFEHNIGHLPVCEARTALEDGMTSSADGNAYSRPRSPGTLLGIVTRSDYLRVVERGVPRDASEPGTTTPQSDASRIPST